VLPTADEIQVPRPVDINLELTTVDDSELPVDMEETDLYAEHSPCNNAPPSDSELNPYVQQGITGELPSCILGDVWHVMDSLLRTISRGHSLRKQFAIAFSDTVFIPDRNDSARFQDYLATHLVNGKVLTMAQFRRIRPEYLWERVRRYIPEPGILYRLLKELFDIWGTLCCSRTKMPLFSKESEKQASAILLKVQRGHISDPSGIPMYVLKGSDKNGLPRY
jgi:hypothetical protein